MRLFRCLGLLALPTIALAQSASPPESPETVFEGRRLTDKDGKPTPMSSWRVAETDNLPVYAGANDERLMPIAHNLQKLHSSSRSVRPRPRDRRHGEAAGHAVRQRGRVRGSGAAQYALADGDLSLAHPGRPLLPSARGRRGMAVPRHDQKVTL